MKCCFECGRSDIEIQNHHVVPKSLGGTKTVPLCAVCHGKIHGLKGLSSGELSRVGIRERQKLGFHQGQVPYGFRVQFKRLVPDRDEQAWINWMRERAAAGMNANRIAKALNEMEVPTKRGHPWERKVVKNILKRRYTDTIPRGDPRKTGGPP